MDRERTHFRCSHNNAETACERGRVSPQLYIVSFSDVWMTAQPLAAQYVLKEGQRTLHIPTDNPCTATRKTGAKRRAKRAIQALAYNTSNLPKERCTALAIKLLLPSFVYLHLGHNGQVKDVLF